MRVKIAEAPFGEAFPPTSIVLLNSLIENAKLNGLYWTKFRIGGLPKSLNQMYERGAGSVYCQPGAPGAFVDKKGRWRRKSSGFQTRLHPEVHQYRAFVTEAMGRSRFEWRPKGVTAAIIFFESPYWLDGKRLVAQKDVDNRAKVILDAIELASEVPDELHWEVHLYKVQSKNSRTTVYLFDMPDVVQYFY